MLVPVDVDQPKHHGINTTIPYVKTEQNCIEFPQRMYMEQTVWKGVEEVEQKRRNRNIGAQHKPKSS